MSTQTHNAIQYNTNEEPIVISKPTLDRLLKLDRPGDPTALYCFYYYTAKWQHSNTPHAANVYVMKGLKWSAERLARAKRDLVHLGLVETVRIQNSITKKFDKPLLKINFIWWKEKTEAIHREKPYIGKSHDMANHIERRSTGIGERRITNTPTEDGSEDDRWEALSDFLSKIIRSKKSITTSAQKVKSWAVELRKLSTVEKLPFDRIRTVMKWYSHNYGGEYVPIAESGRSFRDKFLRIESAMGRDKERSVKGSPPSSPQRPTAPLDPDGQRLHTWLVETLADTTTSGIPPLLAQMRLYHKNIPTDPNHPDQHRATSQLGWESFFNRWMEYLQRKQMTGFTLQSFPQLKIGGARWNEFIQGCEKYTSYSFRTGRYLG